LSAVRTIRADLGIAHFGPVSSMETANLVIDAITSVIPLRTCTTKLSVKKATSSCALADMGRCSAPCELRVSVDEYRVHVDALLDAISGTSTIEDSLTAKIDDYATAERFEEAALHRDRLHAWLTTMVRHHRLESFTRIQEMIATYQNFDGEWEVHVIRHGALAAAARTSDTLSVQEIAHSARLTGQAFETPSTPAPAGSISEAHMILRWCEQHGVRLLDSTDAWHNPWPSQLRHSDIVEQLASARNNAALVAPVKKFARFTAPR
jgi:DNA polymerase-3 subunit epsilon